MVVSKNFDALERALKDENRTCGYKSVEDLRTALLATGLELWMVEEELQEMNDSYAIVESYKAA